MDNWTQVESIGSIIDIDRIAPEVEHFRFRYIFTHSTYNVKSLGLNDLACMLVYKW